MTTVRTTVVRTTIASEFFIARSEAVKWDASLSVDATTPAKKEHHLRFGSAPPQAIYSRGHADEPTASAPDGKPALVRGLTLLPATALNMVDMIGVGPFTTLPLMVAAMHGPQAIYGWIGGAVLALSDGLIWAELGAAMPRAGGSYEYLKEIYGPQKLGRLLSFLFVFQLIFSAPVSMATGCIGLAGYAAYVAPALEKVFWRSTLAFPLLGTVKLNVEISGATLLAMLAAALRHIPCLPAHRRRGAHFQISLGRRARYFCVCDLPRALALPS